ncbi:uncharacterized protein LOC112519285 isoform X3 [Cynara cardunculus var. scolymus]|uniref:uncharacterized protein LOC112519285 isoform X3 n=1 Tax=Cynara cardunculus var. scolymus TaxID=59895 RepID=UPI000D624198|nr:uncharacterized protein LOC112519285 isoform X3 [Cynara cardunculus var. scolymus]
MEHINLLYGQRKNLQSPNRKLSKSGISKDLWVVVREGSVVDVESALVLLKKNGGNINSRNAFGVTPLHIATWRNHTPIVKRLLEAGADPNARDGESGWTSLHRALHFGHLAVASMLLKSDASIAIEDSKSRTPVDLLSGPVLQANGNRDNSVVTELYSWGSGVNYQLGTGNAHIQKLPCKVESLHGSFLNSISSAKFHSVAVNARGEVHTWGFGRGGRLGHPDFDIHSGQAAVITPRQVTSGLGARRVKAIAAAKHHTVAATVGGEVFTWGSNREGQLGYTSVDTQPTPRRVFTWGHRLVTPRRVVVARIIKKSGSTPLKFHRSARLHVVAIAAGMIHSSALTDDGALFYWVSSDPNLRCQQLYLLCGKSLVSISAGKYWTAGVTGSGDVYMWDGKKRKDVPPVVTRLHGVKRATSVSVGETHLLVISSLYHPPYSLEIVDDSQSSKPKPREELLDDEDFAFNDNGSDEVSATNNVESKSIPTLKSLCEKVAAESLLEPRSALQLLEIADSLEAHDLKKHCEEIVIRNLDYILTVASHAIASASLDILWNLEKSLDSKSSDAWSHRRLPTTTATFPAIINSEEDSDNEIFRTRDNHNGKLALKKDLNQKFEGFFQPYDDANHEIVKQVRAIRKKLQQIEMLEVKQSKGYLLDNQQMAKIQSRLVLEGSLVELGVPIDAIGLKSTSLLTVEKGNKKAEGSKKQKKKSKQKSAQGGVVSSSCEDEKLNTVKGFSPSEVEQEEKVIEANGKQVDTAVKETPIGFKKDVSCIPESKRSASSSKKKNRKGGLSMFLNGALDDILKKDPSPPPTPKSEAPAWGGATILKGSTSLRKIQDEQGKTMGNKPAARKKDPLEVLPDVSIGDEYMLSSFFPSKPIPVASITSQVLDSERSTPPWVPSGTPPLGSRPSLRGIQLQQGKKQQTLSHSPKTRTTGFSPTSGQGAPSDSVGLNRWFKPEVETPSSIRSIQIEEKAIKDLKRFYSSVKIIKNES